MGQKLAYLPYLGGRALPPPGRLKGFGPVAVTQTTRRVRPAAPGHQASFGAAAAQRCRHRKATAIALVAVTQPACACRAPAAVDPNKCLRGPFSGAGFRVGRESVWGYPGSRRSRRNRGSTLAIRIARGGSMPVSEHRAA